MAAVVLNSDMRQHKRRPRMNKHLTERRRRARMNDSLTQIKNLVFPALDNKVSQHSKVEKADILEMTLLYIRGLQRQSLSNQGQQQTGDHFTAGFSECLGEVSQFLISCDTVDPDTRMQLLNHLADRCRPVSGMPSPPSDRPSPADTHRYPANTPLSPVSSLPSPSMVSSPDMTNWTIYSPRQFTESTLAVDSYGRRNGGSLSFVTPPTSPIDSSSPYLRNGSVFTQNSDTTDSSRHIEIATLQKFPVWRPWMY